MMDACISEEYRKWQLLWHKSPHREVSAHPDYVRLWAGGPCDRAMCAVLTDSKGTMMFPFVLRSITTEPWGVEARGATDIVSPYGYGGPFAWGDVEPAVFWSEFDGWAEQNHAVSAFVRLSLFQDIEPPFSGDVVAVAPNIVRSLDLGLDEVWMDYRHKVRKNVKTAQRSGVRVELDLEGITVPEFSDLYKRTMERREASECYYFSSSFFESIVHNLKGCYAIFNSWYAGRIVSSELVLISHSYLYSFLGGTDPRYFSVRPNDLLKHSIIEWGIQNGKKAYVLGGGAEGRDGIFGYKSSFAPSGEMPFKVGKRIYNEELYNALILMRGRWESAGGRSWVPVPGFFPAYRS